MGRVSQDEASKIHPCPNTYLWQRKPMHSRVGQSESSVVRNFKYS